MGRVLFVSEHGLERAENLRAVWDAYDGEKEFERGIYHMRTAPQDGYSAVVCDSLPEYMADKGDCKSIVIGHGINGDKNYGLDEKRKGIDARALAQVDIAVNPSTKTVGIMARQFGIPEDRVKPLGMPRTDAYVWSRKGDGGTELAEHARAYLYAPTFRGPNDGEKLPRIDWGKLGSMLEDDEFVVVKRHYFQGQQIVRRQYPNIVEVGNGIGSVPYIIDCDVLLTDYSSILFDAYVAGKPSVLTVDDLASYLETRGTCFDFPAQYGSRWLKADGNEEELLGMLREAAENGMTGTELECRDRVADMCDGHSTERVCELVRSMS